MPQSLFGRVWDEMYRHFKGWAFTVHGNGSVWVHHRQNLDFARSVLRKAGLDVRVSYFG